MQMLLVLTQMVVLHVHVMLDTMEMGRLAMVNLCNDYISEKREVTT